MSAPALSSETLHASCVVYEGRAILISGRSGTGKSDLALRLIDRGAKLVSDDYTVVRRTRDGQLLARAPANIEGKIEVRGIGVVAMEHAGDVPVALLIDLDLGVERLPERREPMRIAGVAVPVVAMNALEASAPVKVVLALEHLGLKV
jgi:serine kinase of HPr protein (carbohydrate metabolism regulator)